MLIAGNWKMNTTVDTVEELGKGIAQASAGIEEGSHVKALICPPFVNIAKLLSLVGDSNLLVGSQNMSQHDSGAFTGEISGGMLHALGCSHVILGHSERRQYYGETDELVGLKISKALENSLTPILCIGESLEQREAGNALDINKSQLEVALANIDITSSLDLVIAYEPIWAIGTGVTASPEQAQEVHAFIRQWLGSRYSAEIADGIQILYGGSMKPANAQELLSLADVDGGLIGGASLKADLFGEIIATAQTIPSKR